MDIGGWSDCVCLQVRNSVYLFSLQLCHFSGLIHSKVDIIQGVRGKRQGEIQKAYLFEVKRADNVLN